MPMFALQVFYSKNTEKWTNVYHVVGADLTGARDAFAAAMQTSLLGILHVSCLLEKVLISSLTDDTFVEASVGEGGDNGDTTDLLPLYNSAKVLFQTDGFGRPDYKFMKGIVTEDANEGGFLSSASKGGIASAFTTIITDMEDAGYPLVSLDNDGYESVTVQDRIQMRQMHRRRKKTAAPTP